MPFAHGRWHRRVDLEMLIHVEARSWDHDAIDVSHAEADDSHRPGDFTIESHHPKENVTPGFEVRVRPELIDDQRIGSDLYKPRLILTLEERASPTAAHSGIRDPRAEVELEGDLLLLLFLREVVLHPPIEGSWCGHTPR